MTRRAGSPEISLARRTPAERAIEPLRWRERRRRLRVARRNGRYLFRGGVVPRSLRAVLIAALATGVGAGAAAAALYAIYDHRLAVAATAAAAPAGAPVTPTAPPAPGEATRVVRRDVVITMPATATGGVARGVGAEVASASDKSYFLTSLDLVRAATLYPPVAVGAEVDGRPVPAALWSWDEASGLALVEVTLPPDEAGAATSSPRPWSAPERRLAVGEVVSVVVPGSDVALSVSVRTATTSATEAFGIEGTGSTLPLGAAVLDTNGALLGILTATGDTATVDQVRSACGPVLACGR